MALPTPPSGSATWTKIPTAGTGPDLYYTSLTSSVQTMTFYCVTNGPILGVPSGVTPSVTSVTWTTNAPASGSYPTLAYAPIEATSSHGLYLLPGGRLVYD